MLLRTLAVWLVIVAAEVVHGIVRTALLEPRVGDLAARQIGVFTGSLIILGIAAASIRWIGATTRAELLSVGLLWLSLTLSFELVFGRFVLGYSWQRLLSDYDPAAGGWLAIGMVVLTLSPLLAARMRHVSSP